MAEWCGTPSVCPQEMYGGFPDIEKSCSKDITSLCCFLK